MANLPPEPTADEQAFLAAVIMHPDEDTPRLMYADWLQENGQLDRAEFIRLHIEWCRRPIDAPPNADLQQRLTTAWDRGEGTWRKVTKTVSHVYDRGFIAGVYPPHHLPFWESASIFAQHPVSVAYSYYLYPQNLDPTFPISGPIDPNAPPYEYEQFLSHPLAERLTALGTDSGKWHDPTFPLLFAHPLASRWRLLHFKEWSDGNVIAQAIAGAPKLNNLLVLELGGTGLEDDAFAALVRAKHLASLISLRVGDGGEYENAISSDGIAALARTKHFRNLWQLDLSDNDDLDDKALAKLLKWEQLQHIRELDLSFTGITEDGILGLSRCKKLNNLRRLGLSVLEFTPSAARAILNSPYLRNLESLVSHEESDWPEELKVAKDARFPNDVTSETFELTVACNEDRICRRMKGLQWGSSEYL